MNVMTKIVETGTEPAIRMREIDLSLGSGASRVHILKKLSLDIPRGLAVGLVGPSGSGKTTLLMTAAGLERPDTGEIHIAGENITHYSEDKLAQFRGRNIGIVFQSFHLIPTLTARENVAIPMELAGADDAFARAEAELQAVGLGHRLEPLSGPALGRRTAARGHCPCARPAPRDRGGG